FTVHVASVSPGVGTPTGQVQFFNNGVAMTNGLVTLDASGNATFLSPLGAPLGNHSVRADYLGDGSYSVSSASTSISIVAAGTRASTVTLHSLNNPSVIGSPVTLRATM